ncbi:SDR family NAD(P)-dependent oxidoreductase, partial [Spirulina sp. 06S082]|uniref:SDR family NAD(P)-dependent oxidoreductase n=1 Tax=Spirulina sp. 06S082 TaxID=3110248 RepID=UPI002B221870
MPSRQQFEPPEPIAIIGIGCRYPGGINTPATFWQSIRNGVDTITEVPPSRWSVERFYDRDPSTPNKANTRWGGFLEQVDRFDPQFFGIAPREVSSMDPQQRLLLEVAWETLEDAGQVPGNLRGSNTGVFIGIGTHDYSIMLWQQPVNDPYATMGTGNCIAANRLSYLFDFKGPSLAVDTACSSSLVAIHLACQSLWQGESDLAIAGGVNILLLPTVTVGFSKGGFMSGRGRCQSFAADADGYVRSEGAGLLLLKPLHQARSDGNPIYAAIASTAVNQDGCSQGMAAPNPEAQAAVLREAYRRAGIDPTQVCYVEAHGTGTKLGDPVEALALGEVLGRGRAPDRPCRIGSVKTNIGHAETAAGVAGAIKAALMLKYREIPPSLHYHQPNPAIDFATLRLQVQAELMPLSQEEFPLYMGVNSFGFGGTNAHLVLKETPRRESSSVLSSFNQLLVLSAKSEPTLKELARRYQAFLGDVENVDLGEICVAASTQRSHFSHRLACIADSHRGMQEQLQGWLEGEAGISISGRTSQREEDIVFLFTGQGSQYVGMGQELYKTQPVFREALHRCGEILQAENIDLLSLLYPEETSLEAEAQLAETANTQPALFALEYALAQLWQAWGIQPTVLLGHSIGEYVAACLAGIFSLEDALHLIAARGRLMQSLPRDIGGMVAVRAEEKRVQEFLTPPSEVAIAALNGPESTVLSGPKAAIAGIIAKLEQAGIASKPLKVSHAFHSPLMTPILAEFRQVAEAIAYAPPKIEIVSTLTGDFATADLISTPAYWVNQIRQPVRFARGLETLYRQKYGLFLECGSRPVLSTLGQSVLPSPDCHWLPSLHPEKADRQQMLSALAQLYDRGHSPNWSTFYQHRSCGRIALPTYPFQRQRYWLTPEKQRFTPPPPSGHPLLGSPLSTPLAQKLFQQTLTEDRPPFLSDHRVGDRVLFPGTAYLEMALAAGAIALKTKTLTLHAVSFERSLSLSAQSCSLQTILDPDGKTYRFQIYSAGETSENWTLHCQGKILPAENVTNTAIALEPLQQSPTKVTTNPYPHWEQVGLQYGAAFQGISSLWCGKDRALGKIQLTEAIESDRADYILYPALFDACLQVVLAAIADVSDAYVPIAIDSLHCYSPLPRSPESYLWSDVQLQPDRSDRSLVTANVRIYDAMSRLLVSIDGLSSRAIQSDRLATPWQNWLYRVQWIPVPPIKSSPPTRSGDWLIVADCPTRLQRIVQTLSDRHYSCIGLLSDRTETPQGNPPCINLENPDHCQDLWTQISRDRHWQGIIYAIQPSSEEEDSETLSDRVRQTCQGLLHWVQALIASPNLSDSFQLWVVTQGVQGILGTECVSLSQAPLWGMARTIAREHPELNCRCLDLDPEREDYQSIEDILLALDSPSPATQIAYRQGIRYEARLHPAPFPPSREVSTALQLQIPTRGSLEQLQWRTVSRRPPEAEEVELRVLATGLNFRDVLNVLGVYPGDAGALGLECVGEVVAIAETVKNVSVGDVVLAISGSRTEGNAPASFSQFITVPAALVVPKPTNLTPTEAATLPIAFLTADYALRQIGKIQRCDRVLIHGAAGGVGQAAVQIAQQVGAEVFATASPQKWEQLRQQGVRHLFNSRIPDFADEIRTKTQGEGVTLVLNSLSGEAIPQSLSALGKGGRFLEIGKTGIWSTAEMASQRPDVDYHIIDLMAVTRDRPLEIQALLSQIADRLQTGQLHPLPLRSFPSDRAIEAFRWLQQGKNIGKIVITPPPCSQDSVPQSPLDLHASYLITGGLGALGLHLAQWLGDRGVRALILTGRNAPSEQAQQAIAKLIQRGIAIKILTFDLGNFSESKTALSPFLNPQTSPLPPLKGIFHLAGQLDDGVLQQQTWARFETVMAAKVQGTWNLHQLTRTLNLDCFVLFSSAAALLGSAGQANYAAANGFLDAIAHFRQQLGLPALSINWGAWSNTGMTAKTYVIHRLARSGIQSLKKEIGWE